MTISGSNDFNQTRDQIIADSLTILGVYRPGATISTADLNICSNLLNKMVKSWDAKGIHVWSEIEGTLFLTSGTNKYTISSTSSDISGDNVVETTLTAAASGASLTVNSITGISASDNIGIVLDNNMIQWTTVSGTPSGSTVALNASLTSAATSGNNVYAFTNRSQKPIHISSCRFRNSDGTDRPVYMRGRDEFMSIPSKTISGKINQVFYAANIADGTMYVWPTPDSCSDRLKFSYVRMLDDFDVGSDNPDFPTEWLETITLNLAIRAARIYGKKPTDIADIIQEAKESLLDMQLWDINNGSIRITPAYREDD